MPLYGVLNHTGGPGWLAKCGLDVARVTKYVRSSTSPLPGGFRRPTPADTYPKTPETLDKQNWLDCVAQNTTVDQEARLVEQEELADQREPSSQSK